MTDREEERKRQEESAQRHEAFLKKRKVSFSGEWLWTSCTITSIRRCYVVETRT